MNSTTENQKQYKPRDIIAYLVRTFPKCFTSDARACRPLKIGILEDIMAAKSEDCPYTKTALRAGLGMYTAWWAYLRAEKPGAARIDLDGNEASAVGDEEARYAAERLRASREKFENEHPEAAAERRALAAARRAARLAASGAAEEGSEGAGNGGEKGSGEQQRQKRRFAGQGRGPKGGFGQRRRDHAGNGQRGRDEGARRARAEASEKEQAREQEQKELFEKQKASYRLADLASLGKGDRVKISTGSSFVDGTVSEVFLSSGEVSVDLASGMSVRIPGERVSVE